nr:hypothetical protein [Tanacetum cinerariifolium]
INQAKYALEILHKHGMEKGQSIGTPMTMKPKLDADLSGNPVDQTDYRSKIGSLMYLTSNRPDIVQAGSSFGLTAFLDADHPGCIDSHKSTSGGIQFLGDKLVSWMSKKQNCTAMSSAEAEYVALSASCAQVITEYQLADMFTKALPEDRFKYLVRQIDLSGNPVDQTDYRSKIGSLMYLTSNRPDIVQAGSSFGLTTFLDADHPGCIDSHKSTSGGIQFLGDKLVSWMSKKQNCTAMSSAEAEYVALSASCAQVMWMRTQL